MYHPYNTQAPDFAEHYDAWWATLKRWFPDFNSFSQAERIQAMAEIDALCGAL